MLILHTSDLHLCENNPERFHALEEILNVAEELKIDMLTISGDLFDSDEDAEALRPKLREMFSGNSFETLVIPGNHDQLTYKKKDLDFGANLKVATEEPFYTMLFKDWSIVAVPFTDRLTSELFSELLNEAEKSSKSILLLHCTLDISFGSTDFGDEGRTYFPISSSTLSRLGFNYVLAGHFHTQLIIKELGNDRMFVYPGSPVSLSWKEIGKRYAAVLNTESGIIKKVPLKTFYRDMHEVYVMPGNEEDVLKKVGDWVQKRVKENCELKILVKGHGKVDEPKFRESLEKVCQGADLKSDYRNVEEVLSHPLYKKFEEKLESTDEIKNKEKVKINVIEAMSRLLAGRKIRR